ncbi:MAG: hypothetical protein ACK42K_03575, partial [Leptonema sp. (in: bacteria)]
MVQLIVPFARKTYNKNVVSDIGGFSAIYDLSFLKEYKKGVKEGHFKKYEPIIITQIFVSSVKNIINPEFILNNNISADKALKETINFIFNSLLTEKGA